MLKKPLHIFLIYLLGIIFIVMAFWKYIIPFPYSLNLAEKNYLNKKQHITMASDMDFPPFSFIGEQIPMGLGYDMDLAGRLNQEFNKIGIDVNILLLPWADCQKMLQDNKVDLLIGMTISDSRSQLYQFTQPYLMSSFSVTSLNENISLKSRLNLLNHYSFVVQSGSMTEELLRLNHIPDNQITLCSGPTECLNQLEKGHADIWLEFQPVTSSLLKTRSLASAAKSINLEDVYAPLAVAARKDDQILAGILDKAFITLNDSGFFSYLDQKWFGLTLNRGITPVKWARIVGLLIFSVYTVIFVFLYWNSLLRKRIDKTTGEISRLYHRVSRSLEDTLNIAAAAIDARDPYTAQHSRMVAGYAATLAMYMRLPGETIYNIYMASLFHDIGKIAIPDYILQKKEALTRDEYEMIKEHCRHGINILNQSKGELAGLAPLIYAHHERYDGKGYPEGAELRHIPASLIVFADAFDAMTSARPYRAPLNNDFVLEEITRGAGTQFHPLVVAYFQELMISSGHGRNVYAFVKQVKLSSQNLHEKIAPNIFNR